MPKKEYKLGLWKQQSKNGLNYYSGYREINWTKVRVTLFKNQKQNDKQPDLSVIIEIEEEEDPAAWIKEEEELF